LSPTTTSSLTPDNILTNLGPSNASTWRVLGALKRALAANEDDHEVRAGFERWRELFCRSSDWAAWSRALGATPQFAAVCESMGADSGDAEGALFVLHTYYALVVKLICAAALGADIAGDREESWSRLEDGSTFRGLGVDNLVEDEGCFAWYLAAMDRSLRAELEQMARRAQEIGVQPGTSDACSPDLLKPLYLALLPRQVRHRLGEFYTPDWLAERVIRLTMGPRDLGDPRCSVLDPACGSGTFLALAVSLARQRATEEGQCDDDALALILENVWGQDLNPLAVLAARANYLLALGPLIASVGGGLTIPVRLGDAVLDPPALDGGFDFVVGNPPWINWEHLPGDYRELTRACWQRLDLFPHRGMDAILGKGKKDISMLMTCVVLERCVRRGGRLGFVLPQGLFKTAGAGEGFRRFSLPGGVPFAPEQVEDLTRVRPFEGASTRPVIAVFDRDRAVSYPVPWTVWTKSGPAGGASLLRWQAEPVDPRRPASPWLTARPGGLAALSKVLGTSDYVAREGANTGGANGVYWVENCEPGTRNSEFRMGGYGQGLVVVKNVTRGARRKVPDVEAEVEAARLYPLLRGRDVQRWRAEPSLMVIMAQDPKTRRGISEQVMARDFPATAAYLARFEDVLASRPAFLRYFRPGRDAWWSMFNVGQYTFAPYKVVWREQAAGFTAAVAGPGEGKQDEGKQDEGKQDEGKPVVPDHKLMLVAVGSGGEAHYLCAALNSAPVRLAVAAYAVSIQVSTHVLHNVAVPRYDSKDATCRGLVKISKRAHRAAQEDDSAALARAERDLDRRAAALWGLSAEELGQIHKALEEIGK